MVLAQRFKRSMQIGSEWFAICFRTVVDESLQFGGDQERDNGKSRQWNRVELLGGFNPFEKYESQLGI